MFIRWKRRQLKVKDWDNVIDERPGRDKSYLARRNEGVPPEYWMGYFVRKYGWKYGDDYSLSAYLVESYRNEEGKPRQRNVAYLGRVLYEKDREPFTKRVWEKFYELVDDETIPADEVDKLTGKLADKVGLVTRDEIAEWREKANSFLRALGKAFGKDPGDDV